MDKIQLSLVAGEVFTWSASDAIRLRQEWRITGSFVGSLPVQDQQNNFFGLPLQLRPEETALLLEQGIAQLESTRSLTSFPSSPASDSSASAQYSGDSLSWDWPRTKEDRARFHVFRALWKQGYYITCGLKFGGDYLLYKGDPSRFHSQYIVSICDYEQGMPSLNLVTHGRLGTTVKKRHILAHVDEANGDVRFYTVEWSGWN